MNIGQKVQLLRKRNGWSQEDLANQINVTRQTVSKWELDEVQPDTVNIIRLCELFHVPADNLLNINCEIENKNTETEQNKTSKYSERKRYLRFGIIFLIAGVLIVGSLFTLSQLIPSRLKATQNYTADSISYVSGQETSDSEEVRTVSYYITVKDFIPFLNTYYLHWLFAIGCVFICLGIFYFVRFKKANIMVV